MVDNEEYKIKTAVENENKLEDDFAAFLNTSSEHSYENNEADEKHTAATNEAAPENNLSFADEFKVTMFIGFIFMFLDGIHAFIYQFVSKYKFDRKELAMDADDKEALEMYFKTPRVAAILNKIPTELIGLAHMEYIYFTKFKEMIDAKKEDGTLVLKKKKRDMAEEEEEEIEEEEVEEVEEKKPVKKVVKKKAVKKAAKKTAKKKNEQGKS